MEQIDRMAEIVEAISVHFDHARLVRECAALQAQAASPAPDGAHQSEEVLRLSEALFAQDIELLRSTEKLGKIERLKDDFIEKMSRELRTPLNSIIEAIISVLTGENDTLSEGAKTALRSALDEGSAFLRTLQNILDLWKIKQGELPVETQDVNFRELVDEAIFSIQDQIGDKPLRIETELIEPFPRLRTDLTKLNQILFLLLDNAAKFTPQGRIVIRGRVGEGKLHVAVEDEGIGICHDDQQFVFDEFFQVDEPASQKYRGAGLGLTLVRDLITLLGGEVSILSDVGRGTTIAFTIPLGG
jgi:signal transduction histidine kinase